MVVVVVVVFVVVVAFVVVGKRGTRMPFSRPTYIFMQNNFRGT